MLFLHIGFHKAGSTSLQTFLRDNAAALAVAGFDYPEVGRTAGDISHQALSKGLKHYRAGSDDLESMWRQVAALAQGDRKVIVSGEGLEQADPEPLRDWLAGTEVKVIAYVRELPARLVSIYAQSIKRGNSTLDFDAFTAREMALDRTFSAPKVMSWANVFGPANVRVRSVDSAVLTGGEVISDFLDTVGLGVDAAARLGLAAPATRNVSPGWKTLEALRALNAEGGWLESEDSTETRSPASSLLRAAQDVEAGLGWTERGLYLTGEQIAEGARVNEADNAAIATLGVDARMTPAVVPPPRAFLPDVSRIPPDELVAFHRGLILSMAREIGLRPRRRRAALTEATLPEPAPATAPAPAPQPSHGGLLAKVGRWFQKLFGRR